MRCRSAAASPSEGCACMSTCARLVQSTCLNVGQRHRGNGRPPPGKGATERACRLQWPWSQGLHAPRSIVPSRCHELSTALTARCARSQSFFDAHLRTASRVAPRAPSPSGRSSASACQPGARADHKGAARAGLPHRPPTDARGRRPRFSGARRCAWGASAARHRPAAATAGSGAPPPTRRQAAARTPPKQGRNDG